MQSLLITAPILPGKLPTWERFVHALVDGRRREYELAMRAAGVSRLRVWRHRGPDATEVALVLFEGETPHNFLGHVASATQGFGHWFRQQLAECHGMDFSLPPPPPPEKVIDVSLAAG